MSDEVKLLNPVSYPPRGDWDRRLGSIACPDLTPVTTLHENEWFSVRNRGGYYTTEYNLSQVVVLPIVDAAGIVMIRVKRPVIGDTTLELPAGAIERGESPVAGGARELSEETGIVIPQARFEAMAPMAPSPNRMPNLIYVFRVDLTREEFDQRRPHDNEVESVHCVPFQEAMRLIADGSLYVALPIAVIASYLFARTPLSSLKEK